MGPRGRDDRRARASAARPFWNAKVVIDTGMTRASSADTSIGRAKLDLAMAQSALNDAVGALPHFDGGEAIATRALLDLMGQVISAKGHLTDLEALTRASR